MLAGDSPSLTMRSSELTGPFGLEAPENTVLTVKKSKRRSDTGTCH